MASFNSIIKFYSIPELRRELDRLFILIYDEEQSNSIAYEAQVRACYVQRELQYRGAYTN